ncbi:hypothetical protein AVEN_79685-1 [Araneus ventricosus]|uniref:Uncharacterized protein n=1 Tax=Araneus ventricosus TaxID=182803 RepID=A0A4Y2JQ50_ARAVE|nr:hypothetical protein AVEN_79685-1 [Araneus ventricosus]
MTRATPELAPPLQTSAPYQREDVWPLNVQQAHMPGGSLVESGFGPVTLLPQSRDLTTRPPRPHQYAGKYLEGVLTILQPLEVTSQFT